VRIDPAVAALVLACASLLFGAAAVHKFRDLRRFDEIFVAYGLLPTGIARHVSLGVPLVEALVCLGLLLDSTRFGAACAGIVLLLGYAAAIGVNLMRGRSDLACGCGGPGDLRPIAAWMVWRNALIAALLGAATLPPAPRALELTDMLTVGCGTAAAALVYMCLDRLLGNTGRARLGA
jgi:hypothetical protein